MGDFLLKPPVPEDTGSARCVISSDIMRKRNLSIGQWVRIDSLSESLYCRAWPALIPTGIIQADNFISKRVKASDRSNLDKLSCSLDPLRVNLQEAKEVILSIKLYDFEDGDQDKRQLYELGFVWKKGSNSIRDQTIKNILNGMVICNGCVVSDKKRGLKIMILGTYPNNELLFTKKSQISIVECIQSKDVDIEIDQISSSLQTISLEGFTNNIPGLEKAYDALFEVVVYPLLYPDIIHKLNIECPKGVLLHGPPGIGKTYLVSIIAKACNAKMISINGPDIFGTYVGESEAKLRHKFSQAKRMTIEEDNPIILFIDELDALTPHRIESQSHESRVVAQLLTLMDGMESRGRLVVIATTNRPNAIDPALRRPGRFDREVSIDIPDEKVRQRILQFKTSKMPLGNDVNIALLSSMTNGYVGADLASLCREAAINAVHRQINCTSDNNFAKHEG
ncbi:8928_t:CDS:10 [Funneliformis geosporum]|uniref:8928_t:CDS:1 n=1 Tax=Funneliformis geosporum TaxID=1117311 RepID=A0A9W4SD01_9GLOM|nr:8928_t:CDS:10 [Funneliformis geosporum]